jgi:hypothetical protein
MFRLKSLHLALFAIAATAALSSLPAFAQEASGWFVVRNATTTDCHPQQLISIGGTYVSGAETKAGGPYATKTQALKRQARLQAEGVCAKG